MHRDVVTGHAVAIRKPLRVLVADRNLGNVAQIQGAVARSVGVGSSAPADNQAAQIGDRLATGEAHGELTPSHIDEAGRGVARGDDGLRDLLRGDAERGETVCVETDLHLTRPGAFQVYARHAGHPRQPRFHHFLHQLLVGRAHVHGVIAGQRAHQHRGCVGALPTVAAKHLRLVGVRRQRWQCVQARDHVQHHAGHVGADLEAQIHVAAAAPRPRAHFDQSRQTAHRLLNRLDQRLFDFVRSGLTPPAEDAQLRLPGVRQQLYGQFDQRQRAKQQNNQGRCRHGGRV